MPNGMSSRRVKNVKIVTNGAAYIGECPSLESVGAGRRSTEGARKAAIRNRSLPKAGWCSQITGIDCNTLEKMAKYTLAQLQGHNHVFLRALREGAVVQAFAHCGGLDEFAAQGVVDGLMKKLDHALGQASTAAPDLAAIGEPWSSRHGEVNSGNVVDGDYTHNLRNGRGYGGLLRQAIQQVSDFSEEVGVSTWRVGWLLLVILLCFFGMLIATFNDGTFAALGLLTKAIFALGQLVNLWVQRKARSNPTLDTTLTVAQLGTDVVAVGSVASTVILTVFG